MRFSAAPGSVKMRLARRSWSIRSSTPLLRSVEAPKDRTNPQGMRDARKRVSERERDLRRKEMGACETTESLVLSKPFGRSSSTARTNYPAASGIRSESPGRSIRNGMTRCWCDHMRGTLLYVGQPVELDATHTQLAAHRRHHAQSRARLGWQRSTGFRERYGISRISQAETASTHNAPCKSCSSPSCDERRPSTLSAFLPILHECYSGRQERIGLCESCG
jgi:hypothetical protein